MGLGKIYWEWNQFETARQYLLDSIRFSKMWREFTIIDSYVSLAQIQQSQGDVDGANQSIVDALIIAAKYLDTETDDRYVASQQAHLWVRQGDLQAARRWATERGLKEYIGVNKLDLSGRLGEDIILRYELIVFSRFLLAEKQCEEALSILNLLLPSLEELGYLSKTIEIHILIAIGMYGQGDITRAISSLKTAANLAESEGFTRLFLDEGPVMFRLLQEFKARNHKSEFVDLLLSTISQVGEKSKTPSGLVESLSDREIEILRLLTTDLTAPEIAEHLHVAVSTMRTHIKNIYGKLDVHSRYEAIAKAKDIHLL
jgi:LuxR family maltose regulon positive regulatory protein